MTIDELKKMLAEAVNSSKKQDEQNLIDLLYLTVSANRYHCSA